MLSIWSSGLCVKKGKNTIIVVLEIFEKCSILFKIKSKIPDSERGKAMILTIPIDIRTGIHTLIYFKHYSLAVTQLVPPFYPAQYCGEL